MSLVAGPDNQPEDAMNAGEMLGPYRVLEKLGEGGMGEVYKARDTRLDRTVAVKVLPPDVSGDPERRARFEREAKTIAGLNHAHVCTLYDVGDHDGAMFLVMEHLEGRTLAERLRTGALPVDEALAVAIQIASALAAAHRHGVIHRDLKPANVMITPDGEAKVLDFGLAKHVGVPVEADAETAAVVTARGDGGVTRRGTVVGTVAYMSPEQVEAQPLDARSDVFSFGALLCEMLTGQQAFQGDSPISTMSAILRDTPEPVREPPGAVPHALAAILGRCLEKKRERRYASGVELHQALVACESELAGRTPGIRAVLRKPRFAIPVLLLVIALVTVTAWSSWRSSRVTWARTAALPEARRLLDEGRSCAAFRLVDRAEKYLGDDPEIRAIRQDFMRRVSFRSDPPGADVYIRDYIDAGADAREDYLGRTPLDAVLVPTGHLRYRVSKAGMTTVEGYDASGLTGAAAVVQVRLDAEGSGPRDMVRIPRGQPTGGKPVEGFWLDKYEVNNRQFKEFAARGGYENPGYWKASASAAATSDWQQVIAQFTDTTGRRGPATWQFGTFPEGQDDYPVSGVSWYEAAAYCESQGKALPTVHHWQWAARQGPLATILQTSNFGGRGPVRAASYAGLGPFGTYDTAGNVREWCWNAVGGKRYVLGGAWSDAAYAFYLPDAAVPSDRSAANGFRCARYERPIAADLATPVDLFQALRRNLTPVSDEVYESYKAFHAYEHGDLEAKVEATSDASPYWREERVSFRAAYGNDRVTAYVFLPKNAERPFQTVVTFPGTYALDIRSSARLERQWFDFIIRSGRALVHPIYKGTYERTIGGNYATYAANPPVWRELALAWYKDFGRSLDYIDSRPDLDREKVAYHGISLGGVVGPRMMALEPRVKAGVLIWSGVGWASPEVNSINFASHCKTPTLMVNGEQDMLNPADSRLRMFSLLGAPDGDKRSVVVKGAGHTAFNQDVIREVLGWLDKYLGPVKTR
jgi:eukaryotic-like serine/threonine-protein kinase